MLTFAISLPSSVVSSLCASPFLDFLTISSDTPSIYESHPFLLAFSHSPVTALQHRLTPRRSRLWSPAFYWGRSLYITQLNLPDHARFVSNVTSLGCPSSSLRKRVAITVKASVQSNPRPSAMPSFKSLGSKMLGGIKKRNTDIETDNDSGGNDSAVDLQSGSPEAVAARSVVRDSMMWIYS